MDILITWCILHMMSVIRLLLYRFVSHEYWSCVVAGIIIADSSQPRHSEPALCFSRFLIWLTIFLFLSSRVATCSRGGYKASGFFICTISMFLWQQKWWTSFFSISISSELYIMRTNQIQTMMCHNLSSLFLFFFF